MDNRQIRSSRVVRWAKPRCSYSWYYEPYIGCRFSERRCTESCLNHKFDFSISFRKSSLFESLGNSHQFWCICRWSWLLVNFFERFSLKLKFYIPIITLGCAEHKYGNCLNILHISVPFWVCLCVCGDGDASMSSDFIWTYEIFASFCVIISFRLKW